MASTWSEHEMIWATEAERSSFAQMFCNNVVLSWETFARVCDAKYSSNFAQIEMLVRIPPFSLGKKPRHKHMVLLLPIQKFPIDISCGFTL